MNNEQTNTVANKVKKTLAERQTALLENNNKTAFDFVKLANVTDKIENKSISKVYSNVANSVYVNSILGSANIPTFAEFKEKMPNKENYSNWDGYKCLLSFNLIYQANKKVFKQNKKIAAI